MTFDDPDPGPPSGERDTSVTGRRVALTAVVVACVVGAAMVFLGLRSSDDTRAVPPSPGGVAPSSVTAPPGPVMPPETLALDPVGVQARIVDATVPDGVLTPPDNVKDVGIWLDGASLDSTTGTTLIVGHVNLVGQGNGALFDLAAIAPGSVIRTSDSTGASTSWRVTSVMSRAKSDGVEQSVLAGADGPRRLAVVTCGGELLYENGVGDYADNVYLYAEPVA